MKQEPVVIEGRAYPVLGFVGAAMGVGLFCFLLVLLFWLWKDGPGWELGLLILVVSSYSLMTLGEAHESLIKRRFAISEVGLEYWKGEEILFQARWENIDSIESRAEWNYDGKPVLEIKAGEGSFAWKLGQEGGSRETLRQVFKCLRDWAEEHPHIRVVKKGIKVTRIHKVEKVEETEVLQEGED